jgi:hypothetical protein
MFSASLINVNLIINDSQLATARSSKPSFSLGVRPSEQPTPINFIDRNGVLGFGAL